MMTSPWAAHQLAAQAHDAHAGQPAAAREAAQVAAQVQVQAQAQAQERPLVQPPHQGADERLLWQ